MVQVITITSGSTSVSSGAGASATAGSGSLLGRGMAGAAPVLIDIDALHPDTLLNLCGVVQRASQIKNMFNQWLQMRQGYGGGGIGNNVENKMKKLLEPDYDNIELPEINKS